MLTGTGKFWVTAPRKTPRNPSVVGRQEKLSPHGQSSSSNWGFNEFRFVEEGIDHWAVNELFSGPRIRSLLNVIFILLWPPGALPCAV
jgi:hypothetical protein